MAGGVPSCELGKCLEIIHAEVLLFADPMLINAGK